MSLRFWQEVGGPGNILIAPDPAAAIPGTLVQFPAFGTFWTARTTFVPTKGALYVLLPRATQVEAMSSTIPTSSGAGCVGIDPNDLMQWQNGLATGFALLPKAAATGTAQKGLACTLDAAGRVIVSTSKNIFIRGFIEDIPEPATTDSLVKVRYSGRFSLCPSVAGVTAGDKLVIDAAGKFVTSVAGDLLTSNGASPALVLGTMYQGTALATSGANLPVDALIQPPTGLIG